MLVVSIDILKVLGSDPAGEGTGTSSSGGISPAKALGGGSFKGKNRRVLFHLSLKLNRWCISQNSHDPRF